MNGGFEILLIFIEFLLFFIQSDGAARDRKIVALNVQKSRKEIEEFECWKKCNNKFYSDEMEEERASDFFVIQKRKILEFNSRSNETYKMDILEYADEDPDELFKNLGGFKMDENEKMIYKNKNATKNSKNVRKIKNLKTSSTKFYFSRVAINSDSTSPPDDIFWPTTTIPDSSLKPSTILTSDFNFPSILYPSTTTEQTSTLSTTLSTTQEPETTLRTSESISSSSITSSTKISSSSSNLLTTSSSKFPPLTSTRTTSDTTGSITSLSKVSSTSSNLLTSKFPPLTSASTLTTTKLIASSNFIKSTRAPWTTFKSQQQTTSLSNFLMTSSSPTKNITTTTERTSLKPETQTQRSTMTTKPFIPPSTLTKLLTTSSVGIKTTSTKTSLPAQNLGKSTIATTKVTVKPTLIPNLPARINYSSRFSPVKNQMGCGSCYAFAAVALVEYETLTNLKQNQNLSEQCVVDCLPNGYGCVGGSPAAALDFAKMFGLSNGSPKFYEYKGFKGTTCRMKQFPAVRNLAGGTCTKYLNGDEDQLKLLVSKQPVIVGVSMTMNMLFYKSGIFSDPSCNEKLNHVVVVVGYDTDVIGQDYWIVRNSWGKSWGMSGYGYFLRNKNNSCGIASLAFHLC